jgi:hypothetical protein
MPGFQLSTQVTVGDVLTTVGLLGGLISLYLIYMQVRASNRQTQLTAAVAARQFVLDLVNRSFDDPEMLRLYYQLDNRTFRFDPDTFLGSPDATAVTRTLNYFDTVGYLVDKKLISLGDVAILKHRIISFFDDLQVRTAFDFMYSRGRVVDAHELALNLYTLLTKS